MNRAPIVVAFAALAAGVAAAEWIRPSGAVAGVGLALTLGLLAWAVRARQGVAISALLCLALAGSFSSAMHVAPEAPETCDDASHRWRAEIHGPVQRSFHARRKSLVQRVELDLVAQRCGESWLARRGRVRVGLWLGPDVARGDTIDLRLDVTPLSLPRNLTDPEPISLGRTSGLAARARVRSVHVVTRRSGGSMAFVDRLRRRAAVRLEGALVPEQAAVAKALATGDRGAITPEQRDRWARAGIAHLLAISGLHVGLIAALVFFLLRALVGRLPGAGERYSIRRVAAALTVPFVAGFTVWVGAPPSAVRACVMATAFLVGLVIGRPNTAANALGAAGVLLLAADPMSLYDAGFLLSFSAAAALLLVPSLPPAQNRMQRVKRALIATAVASLVATLATAPVTAYHFGQVSLVAPITNIVAVPLGAILATPLALLAITLGSLATWLEPLFTWPLGVVIAALESITVAAGQLEIAALDVPRPSGLEILAYVALLFAAAASLRRRPARYLFALAALVLAGSILWRVSVRSGDGSLVVRFPYVGQGDAAVITLPKGGVVVVDAGGGLQPGDWDPGRGVVAPLLRRLGIASIDLAVVSHPHPDHIGGFAYLAEHFPISELWWNGDAENSSAQRALVERVRAGGGTTRIAANLPRSTTIEGVVIEVLHPRPGDRDAEGLPYFPALNANDNSIVLRLILGERSLLLPGDIEAESEARLGPTLPPTDILKSPHHGSRTSSTGPLLEALQARLVVISCGEDNRFGFPNPEVLADYETHGIEVLRTDTDGMIELRTTGSAWSVSSLRGRELTLR